MKRPGGASKSKRPQPRGDAGGGGGLTAEEAARLTEEQEQQIAELENEIRKMNAEKDLLELKLKSAERSRGNLQEQLKTSEARAESEESETGTLRRKIEEVERLIAVLQGEVNSLKALKASKSKKAKKPIVQDPPPEAGATAEAGAAAGASTGAAAVPAASERSKPTEEKPAKAPASVSAEPSQAATAVKAGEEAQAEPAAASPDDANESVSDGGILSPAFADVGDSSLMSSSDEESEDPTEKESSDQKGVMDKCVGTDDLVVKLPEPQEDRAPTRAILPPREVNKNGHSFVRKVRSRVRLSLAGMPAGM